MRDCRTGVVAGSGLLLLCLLMAGNTARVNGQEPQPAQPTIAFIDFPSGGGLDERNVTGINDYLRGRLQDLAHYRFVELDQQRAIVQKYSEQRLLGIFDEQSVGNLQLTGADQLILGNVGQVFDWIVVTARVVDLETGEIEFSTTVNATEGRILESLDAIVRAVDEHGAMRSQVVTLDEIERRVKHRRYIEARDLIDRYVEQQSGAASIGDAPARLVSLQGEVREHLYDDYLSSARRARRRDDFAEARDSITRAISIRPSSEAFEERDRIRVEEESYERTQERRLRLIEQRAREEEQRERAGAHLGPWESFSLYLQRITATGTRLGVSTGWWLPDSLELPGDFETMGISVGQTFRFIGDGRETVFDAQSVALYNFTIDYASSGDSGTTSISAGLSPHSAIAFKAANVVVTTGITGGGFLQYGEQTGGRYESHATVGICLLGEMKIAGSRGFHAGVQVDNVFGSLPEAYGRYYVRLFSGVTL